MNAPASTTSAVTILRGGTIVTCDSDNRVVEGDVVIRGREILAIGPGASDAAPRDAQVIDARGKAVIPGLIQAHVHLVQALFRGIAEERPLLEWLRDRIWPLESAHDEASLRASAELGLGEMVRAGTTTILDMGTVHDHDVVMDACVRSGIRAFSGKCMMDQGKGFPKRMHESRRSSVRESERLADVWNGQGDGRIEYAFAPRFILSCSEDLMRETAIAAAKRGNIVHTHAAEHAAERKAVKEILGKDDIEALASYGITGPRAVLAHGVQLRPAEIKKLARVGTRITHCPSANLKLGSGIAPVLEMRNAGVVVGLGADGAPCNNNMDPWVEMRHAALLGSVKTSPGQLKAIDVLRMATIDGARLLGIDRITGSLEIGKRADLVLVRLDDIHVAPAVDPVATLVYACQSRDVTDVMVDGRWLMSRGEPTGFDVAAVAAAAREQARKVMARAKVH